MATRRTLLGTAALATAAAAAATRPARATDWQPDRAITMIVAFAAGGGTDAAARTLARFMERDLGQPRTPPEPLALGPTDEADTGDTGQ